MNSKIVICYIDYSGAADFFLEMAKVDKNNEYIFITTLLSVKIRGLFVSNVKVYLINKFTYNDSHKVDEDFSACKEQYLNLLSKKHRMKLESQVIGVTNKIISYYNEEQVTLLTWNGNSIFGKVIRTTKISFPQVRTLFLEISNLPGLLFSDPEGVNSASALYKSDEISEQLRMFESNGYKYSDWAKKYIEDKTNNNTLPPQSLLIKAFKPQFILDFIYSLTIGYRFFRYESVASRIPALFKSRKTNTIVSERRVLRNIETISNFNFFPMQVSTDSQIMLNSDYDNIQALELFLKTSSLPIVLKLHPADIENFDFEVLDALDPDYNRVFICSCNTYELIQKAECVYTINSTVGLESLIFEKKVLFIGRTLYSKFDRDDLENYVTRFLLKIDFFSPKLLSKSDCHRIHERAK